jgi:hemoglobin-like flavoprotein
MNVIPSYLLPLTCVITAHSPEITPQDLTNAKASWNLIIEDESPLYKELVLDLTFRETHHSCITWFYSEFYRRLFDVHPACRPLFSTGLVSQGKFLVKMVSLSLACITHREKFTKAMEDLAMRHCERGVRGVEYGIVGDVLFYSLQKVTGSAFTLQVEDSWKRIYSAMLAIIVPLCIEYERCGFVHRLVERETDYSGGEILDSATLASREADKKIADRARSG